MSGKCGASVVVSSVWIFAIVACLDYLVANSLAARAASPEEESAPPATITEAKLIQSLLRQLDSPQPAEFRIAQANLARMGRKTLPSLERAAKHAAEPQQHRFKEVVAIMLLLTVDLEEMKKYPGLMGLIRLEMKAAEAVARILHNAKEFDTGAHGPMSPGIPPPPPSDARQAMVKLKWMGCFAVPTLVRMAREGTTPATRMYASDILIDQGAEGQLATLQNLSFQNDQTLTLDGGDYVTTSTVADQTKGRMRGTHPFVRRQNPATDRPCFDAEAYLTWLDRFERPNLKGSDTKLINRLRQDAKTYDAKSWDAYWQKAKPILSETWSRK